MRSAAVLNGSKCARCVSSERDRHRAPPPTTPDAVRERRQHRAGCEAELGLGPCGGDRDRCDAASRESGRERGSGRSGRGSMPPLIGHGGARPERWRRSLRQGQAAFAVCARRAAQHARYQLGAPREAAQLPASVRHARTPSLVDCGRSCPRRAVEARVSASRSVRRAPRAHHARTPRPRFRPGDRSRAGRSRTVGPVETAPCRRLVHA
jgi:hypothetical protein